MKKESQKLLEMAALAEKDMRCGETELKNAGSQVQHLDLMEDLREIPGREALKLRAEVGNETECQILSSSFESHQYCSEMQGTLHVSRYQCSSQLKFRALEALP